jgi:hypothetical protein
MGFFLPKFNKMGFTNILQYTDINEILESPAVKEATKKENETAKAKGNFEWGFLANVADAIPQLTGQFNGKFQNNQLAIAEANARAAEAQAQSSTAQPRNNTIAWVAAIIAILIIAYFLINKK